MSKRDSGYLGFGLALGGIIVLLVFVWGDAVYDYMQCIRGHPCEHYQGNYEDGNEPDWWADVRWLVGGEDTIAQWLMMVFTAAGAGLLYLTLRATMYTANITREIGRIQARAYLSVDSLEDFELGNLGKIVVCPKLKNSGNSPAFNVSVNASVFDSDGNEFAVELPKEPPPTRSIQAGGEVEFRTLLFTPSVTNWHEFVRVFITVSWGDVFEDEHEFHQVFWLITGQRNIGNVLRFGEGDHP